jgi:DNA topoisomerase-2
MTTDKLSGTTKPAPLFQAVSSQFTMMFTEVETECPHDQFEAREYVCKLEDALYAGSDRAAECTLIITEGDSAMGTVMNALSDIDREYYGVLAICGTLLNTRGASEARVRKNGIIQRIVTAMGLDLMQVKGSTDVSTGGDAVGSLQYGRIMMMCDPDPDGSHIKGLIISFVHSRWPWLLGHDKFLSDFIMPIAEARKGGNVCLFNSCTDFTEWKLKNDQGRGWNIKCYQSVGNFNEAEMKHMFMNRDKRRRFFFYGSTGDNDRIDMAFNPGRVADRKTWVEH